MKKLCFSLLMLLTLPVLMFAQQGYNQGGGNPESNVISIFSENGDYFLVVLNGVTQNFTPQTSLRIDGITQTVNEIQILFADNRTREIRRTVNIANPVDRQPITMVMKIDRERDGEAKLRFVRSNPRERDYQPMQGEYVMYYGQDVRRDGNQNPNGNWDQNRDYNGGHHDVVIKETVIQAPPPPPVPVGPVAMDDASFQSAKQSIANNSFDDTKLSTAKMIANTNFFSCDQVMQICALFSFEDSKLNFAKYAYKKTVDNNNYFRVNDVFTFDASKEALNNYVSRGGH